MKLAALYDKYGKEKYIRGEIGLENMETGRVLCKNYLSIKIRN